MDAISDPHIHTVVALTASQVGKTEAILNTLGFHIHRDACPILIVQPTLQMAEAFSKDRLAPMVRDTPALRGRVGDPRSRDSGNTLLHKQYAGGHVTMSGANSPASLAMRPVRLVLCDEVDRYDDSAGTEGDPVSLAAKRSVTFWNRKLVLTSTPTRKGLSRIEKAYDAGDRREFYCRCPDCAEAQTLRWAQVRWDKTEEGEHLPETAHYVCEHCGSLWGDVQRWRAVRAGEWRAERPCTGTASFRVSALYSGWLEMADIVREFLEKRHDTDQLQTFINTTLGELWEEPAEKVEGSPLLARAENYGPQSLPSSVLMLTAGVDVQGDRLECQVLGWGLREECWVVEHEVIYGDPSQAAIWADLDRMLVRRFHSEVGRELRIRSACIDTGGHHQHEVIEFCKVRKGRRIFPIKGRDGPNPVWPKWGSTTKTNQIIYMVGVDTAKDVIYGRLRLDKIGPGYVHFPIELPQEYYDQLTSERVITRRKLGKPVRVWELPPRMRNEALDTFVYALAARHSIPIRLGSVDQTAPLDGPPPEAQAAELPQVPPPPVMRTPAPKPPRRVIMRSRYMS